MSTKLFFYILVLTLGSCASKVKPQTIPQKPSDVKGRILERYLGEFRSYSGHPVAIDVTLELINNSDTPYLLCGLDGDIIYENGDFGDTIRIFHSMLIEPHSVDTIRNKLILTKSVENMKRVNYEKGSFTYYSKNECVVNDATIPHGMDGNNIPLSIKPIDYVFFEGE